PSLARALRGVAADGPDLFYTGRVGQAIAGRLEPEGFLTVEDLATHTGEWGEPIATTYRGVRVFQTPPPTQGLAALLALNLIEGFPLATLKVHSVEHLHLLLEMVKLAYADRDRWIGDPAHARLPVEALLSKAYAARRRAQFAPEAPLPHAHRLHRHAGRRAPAGVGDDGRQRSGDVPRAGRHQRPRLRHGHSGSDRAAALPDRRVPARRAGGHDPHRGARAGPR